MTEQEDQMSLFNLDEEQPDEQCAGCDECEPEPCKHCDANCTSSKECTDHADPDEPPQRR